ncbi:failed axon connections homolog [Paramacrobiotus metropolitanus]|uniref:failed axon connections homolog n=1 Tax=Paramacrobiotus metropolitanus TaxID=2943436 RepID=UPI002445B421|nr:failed axon connections homolog [Paramacrobiotus metropolitanus]XP_055350618.1 failed axon connections homolog [Paramacrobiotus metropolitanus]XP_055350619.1 failed axon connections homolog [Paramacrobiotus metropolitanus]XP_055350620.1 failed axon connections homolog [Paramacrobiotus metropolitanus]
MAADTPVMDSSVVTETATTTVDTTTTEAPRTTPDVVLHHFGRTAVVPDVSPFGLKLETYLRMTKVNFENDFAKPHSSKTGKAPWLTYAGQDVSDSSMCIDFLKLKTGLDLNSTLTPSEKGINRAFQKLVEEELYWVLVLWRWSYDKEETVVKQFPFSKLKDLILPKIIRSRLKAQAHAHGIGRFTAPEVMKMGEDDVTAIGEYLGCNPRQAEGNSTEG